MSIRENIVNYFRTPQILTDDPQEEARFIFAWRLNIFFIATVFILTFLSFVFDYSYKFYFLIVLSILLISRGLTREHDKHYKLMVNLVSFIISVIIFYTVLIKHNDLSFLEIFWMIVIILTTHFVLGIKWGRFYILLTSIVYFLYFNFFFLDTEGFKIILQPHTLFIYTIEFIITLFLIGFIMYNYETLNEKIISKYTDAFYELKDEKIVVEKQNQEKAILLQEIHHRVKNNFQIIVSLLRMQSNTIEDEETRDSFQQAINRIATMSLVHQKLYESTSLAEVNLNEYLEKLVHEIMNSYSVQGNITYSVHSEIENFDSEKIVMLGLIINELVSNSLKYAFKGEGNINIHIFRSEEGSVQLNYSDNGKWLKKPNNQAFGIKLIDIFIEQLDGTYERMIKENGTFYYFKLRNII